MCTSYKSQVEDDPTGGRMADAELHKLHNVASFHVGDIITSLQKGSLVSGGQEAIIYSTLMGGIGTILCVQPGVCTC